MKLKAEENNMLQINEKIKKMNERLEITGRFKLITIIMSLIGLVVFVVGLVSDPKVTWASYLTANYYFLSLSMGAAFFFAIQYISQSGWSSAFIRIPTAMMSWIPFSAIFFIILYFGIHSLYEWSHEIPDDLLLQHKSPYLNIPFFFIRLLFFFLVWIILALFLRKLSLNEDNYDKGDLNGIGEHFTKIEFWSKVFIFSFSVTFTLAAFDWIMSIQPHWYSSIFAFKNVIAAFLHGTSIIALLVFILNRRGYFPFFNVYHLHDFARYIFILSIIWGYMWFAQYMIIWYGNIPEETAYYYYRWESGWKIMFYLQIILNWAVPFLVLLPVKTSRNMTVITAVIVVLIIGQYIDLFVQIFPAITGDLRFGWIEAGLFIGFAGIFSFVTGVALSRAKLVPENHPYLNESINHKFV